MIPIRLPLKEFQFSGVLIPTEFWELTQKELNVEKVSVLADQQLANNWIEKEKGKIKVRLNCEVEEYQLEAERKTKKRRQEIMKRKQKEL